jgi:hypothetical protein
MPACVRRQPRSGWSPQPRVAKRTLGHDRARPGTANRFFRPTRTGNEHTASHGSAIASQIIFRWIRSSGSARSLVRRNSGDRKAQAGWAKPRACYRSFMSHDAARRGKQSPPLRTTPRTKSRSFAYHVLPQEILAWFNSSTVGVTIGGCRVGNALRGVPSPAERHGVRSLQNSVGELLPRFEPGRNSPGPCRSAMSIARQAPADNRLFGSRLFGSGQGVRALGH